MDFQIFLDLMGGYSPTTVLTAFIIALLFLVVFLLFKIRSLRKEKFKNVSRINNKKAEINRLRDVYGGLTGYTQFGDLPDDLESAIRSAVAKSPTKGALGFEMLSLVDDESLQRSLFESDINLLGELANGDWQHMLHRCQDLLTSLVDGSLDIEELPNRSELDVIAKLALRAEAFAPNSYAAAKFGLILSSLRYQLALAGIHLIIVKPLTIVASEEISIQYEDVDRFLKDTDIRKGLEAEYFALSQGPRRDTHFAIADCQRVGFVSATDNRLPTALVFDRNKYV